MSHRIEDDTSLDGTDPVYLHIREPEQEKTQVSDPERQIKEFLQPYEEGLIGDTQFYSTHPELLSKIELAGHFWNSDRPIKRMQFWTNEDRYTFWAVEMDLENLLGSIVRIPRITTFVRLSRNNSNTQLLRQVWTTESNFLHPRTRPIGDGYDYDLNELNPGIFSHTQISMSNAGRIYHISIRSRDEVIGVKSFQEISLERNENPSPSAITTSNPILLIQQILQTLPLERLQHQKPSI